MAHLVREWAKEYFALFPKEAYASQTLTAVKNTRELCVSSLNTKLAERGYCISNGYGSLRDKTFRIAHMGDTTIEELSSLLSEMEQLI